ncbi:hypothetical protein ABZS76_33090 [Streptomyces sp. NPDC005562]|uniref:hypothetical protein n=1 Tax=Streptomyces sp. NPDC005562 TaxID=3154890 RepID=UPI0033BBA71A
MTQTDPQSLGELWRMIERDSASTREHVRLSREEVRRELDDVKRRLDSFVTTDHFEAEKRILESRITFLEEAMDQLERSARDEVSTRSHNRREFVYKGIIPSLALIVAIVSIFAATR